MIVPALVHMLTVVLLLTFSCGQELEDGPDEAPGQPERRSTNFITALSGVLAAYDVKDGPDKVSRLPRALNEISGLATTPDGRLFAHDDESGNIYQLDAMTGSIIKHFILGRTIVLEDFEGLAFAEGFFYLVTSDGELFKFREGADRERVRYETYSTFLRSKNDVEGLCFDPETRCLLLACKGSPGKGFKGKKAVYAFSLETNTLLAEPRFLLSEKKLAGKNKHFSPSAIERHPDGTFMILSAKSRSIAEISTDGQIIDRYSIKKKRHSQPEGLAFLQLNEMVVSDEASNGTAALSVYQGKQ